MKEKLLEFITRQDVYTLLQNNANGLTVSDICDKLNQCDDSQVVKILRLEKKYFWAIDGIHWCIRDIYSPEEESKIIVDNLYKALCDLPRGHSFNTLVSMFPSYGKIQIKRVLKSNNDIFTSCGTRWGIVGVFDFSNEISKNIKLLLI